MMDMYKVSRLNKQFNDELELIEKQREELEERERTVLQNRRGLYTLLTIFEQYGEQTVRDWTRRQFIDITDKDLKVVEKNMHNEEHKDLILKQYKKDLDNAFQWLFDVGV